MTRFMTLDFADGDRPQMLARVIGMARGAYGYVVTPNVDHVIKLMDGRVGREVYAEADLKICDSRILRHLARLRGKPVAVLQGTRRLAGTAARFLTALCAAAPGGSYRLDGVPQMRKRPMKPLIDALRTLGYLATHRDRPVLAREIAAETGIPSNYLSKVLAQLRKARHVLCPRRPPPRKRRVLHEETVAVEQGSIRRLQFAVI